MYIKDVCRECKLTKKAIEYYEQQGLISPKREDNGYRNYSDEDISVLKEIGVLRKLGISIDDIKNILTSSNKASALGFANNIKITDSNGIGVIINKPIFFHFIKFTGK